MMRAMERHRIEHLGELARIRLTDAEIDEFTTEIEEILAYVGTIAELTAEHSVTKQPGALVNVMREDEVTNEPVGDDSPLLTGMPERDGRHLKVPRILTKRTDHDDQ